jgi:hypothetical protein
VMDALPDPIPSRHVYASCCGQSRLLCSAIRTRDLWKANGLGVEHPGPLAPARVVRAVALGAGCVLVPCFRMLFRGVAACGKYHPFRTTTTQPQRSSKVLILDSGLHLCADRQLLLSSCSDAWTPLQLPDTAKMYRPSLRGMKKLAQRSVRRPPDPAPCRHVRRNTPVDQQLMVGTYISSDPAWSPPWLTSTPATGRRTSKQARRTDTSCYLWCCSPDSRQSVSLDAFDTLSKRITSHAQYLCDG